VDLEFVKRHYCAVCTQQENVFTTEWLKFYCSICFRIKI